MYNWQQFGALAEMASLALVAPIPFTQLWQRDQGQPPGDRFPVRRPVFWYAPKLGRSLQGRFMLACAWPALRAMSDQLRPQVLLANWAYPDGWAGVQAARRLGLPVVLQLLGSDINFMANDPVRKPLIQEALTKADLITTVSAPLREKTLDLGVAADKVMVLPNGVDTYLFRPADTAAARLELGLPAGKKVVLFLGHLVLEKGPAILLEALAQLPQDVMLVVVGTGPLAAELKNRATALGVSGRIKWAGEIPHDRIPVFMAACDCLALPSLREGEPNVVLEALASGRPVAASKVGGVPLLVRDGAQGHLSAPGDAKDLARALRLTLEADWDPRQIAASISGRTWRASASQLLSILKRAARVQDA
jgi:teichuronic acid biosynthesis glycosyltransferase TuaC